MSATEHAIGKPSVCDLCERDDCLKLTGLSYGFADEWLFRGLDCGFPHTGISALLGASGIGKSTLLKLIAGYVDGQPGFHCEGRVELAGESLLDLPPQVRASRIAYLPQKARLYGETVRENLLINGADVEQLLARAKLTETLGPLLDEPVMEQAMEVHRMIVLARQINEGTRYLLLDEPMRDVSMRGEERLLSWFQALSEDFGVLLITHNKEEAKALAQHVVLLGDGGVIESRPCEEFFASPSSEKSEQFIQSGSAGGRLFREVEDESVETQQSAISPSSDVPEPTLPYEFHWVLPRLMGGCQQPDLTGRLQSDLLGLENQGVKVLVTLTERPLELASAKTSMRVLHFPVDDMGVPSLGDARALCQGLNEQLEQQAAVVFHCRAGLGRTGTLMACMLVYRGESASRAIERIRIINSGYVQSEDQYQFVHAFERSGASRAVAAGGLNVSSSTAIHSPRM